MAWRTRLHKDKKVIYQLGQPSVLTTIIIMESEERPSKMRKLTHEEDSLDVATVEHAPADVPEAQKTPQAEHDASVLEENDMTSEILTVSAQTDDVAPKLSKNQIKKQARLERWESGREDRKVKRREKIKEKKERKRQAWEESRAKGESIQILQSRASRRAEPSGTQVPITIIFDCDFDDLMFDNELKSLGLQLTRSYSDNRKAPYRCHLAVSSFGGKLKERFDGILAKQYTSWKGVHFCEEDFVKVSEMAGEWMSGGQGGDTAGALAQKDVANEEQEGDAGEAHEEGEVVYLSAESDVTLERLKPNSTYIIGGLVDKNRHKGLCYKRAMSRGIKTAKLPIGEFLQMKSRQVLVTNHVLEIMLKWLELNDWGKAFMEVLPKRKGGVLKSEAEQGEEDLEMPEEDENGEEVEADAQHAEIQS
jgi:tRNA (guanine9-N1)-methyltransferase